MKTFMSETEIAASTAAVWSHITDLARDKEWHPILSSASGELREGAVLAVQVPGVAQPMRARVLRLEPGHELTLLTLWPLGLIRPVYTQRVEPVEEDRTRYVSTETFSGLLLPLLAGRITRNVAPLYQATCEALKTRVEGMRSD